MSNSIVKIFSLEKLKNLFLKQTGIDVDMKDCSTTQQ